MTRLRHFLGAGGLALILASAAWSAFAAPRVLSLDQCADQYVLALTPRSDIAGLSYRSDEADSYLRAQAVGLRQRRATLESVLASGAGVVVRYWGGDDLMARRLAARGVKVVKIDDANDFDAVRANLRRVSAALGRPAAGEALIAGMEREIDGARGAWSGQRAVYLTPGGFTAGPDTLVGAMIAGAGLRNGVAVGGYSPLSLERLVSRPPDAFVLGFFDRDSLAGQRWSIGRHAALKGALKGRTIASLPAAILGCPAWFAADGPRDLAAARARP